VKRRFDGYVYRMWGNSEAMIDWEFC
jgi:hypothetical protein